MVINEATCDCTALLWTNPSTTAVTVAVASTATPTFPTPIQDTTNRSTNAAFDKCFIGSNTGCASTGSFPAATVLYDDGSPSGTTLPSWITYSDASSATQTISLAPIDGTATGTHNIFVVFDSTYGPNPNYTALTITVTCQVTSITQPSNPVSNLGYIVYDATNIHHDFTTSTYT